MRRVVEFFCISVVNILGSENLKFLDLKYVCLLYGPQPEVKLKHIKCYMCSCLEAKF